MNKKKCAILVFGTIAAIGVGVAIARVLEVQNKKAKIESQTTKATELNALETKDKECPYSAPISCDFCEDAQNCKTPHVRNCNITMSAEKTTEQID